MFDNSKKTEALNLSCLALSNILEKEAIQFKVTYAVISKTAFVKGSSVIKSEKGIGGLFSWPTTAVNTLETKATTNRSINPVIMAIGKRVNKDLLV